MPRGLLRAVLAIGPGSIRDRHNAAAELTKPGVNEARLIHQLSNSSLAGIELQGFWNVAVGIRVAVQGQADSGTSDAEVAKVRASVQPVSGLPKVQGQQA